MPELANTGYLPVGRFPASLAEVEAKFAYNDRRQQLMGQFKALYGVLSAYLGEVPACWLGGSFLSAKEEPGDIDVVFLIRGELLGMLNEEGKKLLTCVAQNRTASVLHLNLDTFVLSVNSPLDANEPAGNSLERSYLFWLGYWDNLWSATRLPDNRLNPRTRGYLEVSPNVG